jgi:hypothetical protein
MTDVMWWITVLVYWAVVSLCLVAVKFDTHKLPWKISMVAFAVLAINKQHNLTGLITKTVRGAAVHQHWYGRRTGFQVFILLGIGIAFVAIFVALQTYMIRLRWSPSQRAVSAVAIYLTGFATARAVSLHAIDALLYQSVLGIKLNWVFELGGLVIAAAFIAGNFVRKSQP